jgi:hypothetical protein
MADMAGWMFHVWSYSKKKRRKKSLEIVFGFGLTLERPRANQSVGERQRKKSIVKERKKKS